MIGHTLNGHTIVAAAPDSNSTWAILAVNLDRTTYQPWVVSSVDISQVPEPTSWGQGSYTQDLDSAALDYLDRLRPHGSSLAYTDDKEFARQLDLFCQALTNLAEHLTNR